MKRRPTYPTIAAVAALGFIWTACSDAPTESPAELAAPQFKKGGKPGPPTPDDAFPTIVTFRPDLTDKIRSDDELRSDDLYNGPAYEDGVCGVTADLGNFDDARMNPDANYRKGRHLKTCGDARVLIIELDDPDDDGGSGLSRIVAGVFSNIDQVLTVTGTDPELHWGVFNAPDPCGQLFFDPAPSFHPSNASNLLLVSYDGADTWTVRTQDFPNDVGFCSGDGRLFHMPFQMTIRRQ